jgi:RimJ/RimL family protein N-acetyltransferase
MAGEGPCRVPDGFLDFRVRRVEAGDEGRLSRFYASLSDGSRYFFEPFRDTSPEALRQVVERTLAGTDFSLVVEAPDGEVIAHIFYSDIFRETPHLGIGLRDVYHGCGLGGVLLAYLIRVGKHVLCKRSIGLTVVKENHRALHLYKKHGFQVVRDDVQFRQPGDSYEMELTF